MRNANSADLSDVELMWWRLVEVQSAWEKSAIPSSANRRVVRDFLRHRLVSSRIVVSEVNSHKVGMASMSLLEGRLENLTQIHTISDVWVFPKYRRLGIASQMIEWLEQHAWGLGADEVRLAVHFENNPARSLYRHMGYVPHTELHIKQRPID